MLLSSNIGLFIGSDVSIILILLTKCKYAKNILKKIKKLLKFSFLIFSFKSLFNISNILS